MQLDIWKEKRRSRRKIKVKLIMSYTITLKASQDGRMEVFLIIFLRKHMCAGTCGDLKEKYDIVIVVDVVAHWQRTRLLRQRSRVRIQHLPQWSWWAAGSLWNKVEIHRVKRETYPWGKPTPEGHLPLRETYPWGKPTPEGNLPLRETYPWGKPTPEAKKDIK